MERFSEKVFLRLTVPTDEDSLGDQQRLREALEQLGYDNVVFPLPVQRKLYPLCRDCGFAVTVTLVCRQTDWVVTAVEPGDRRQDHYALAVDYGSTTIVMALVDMHSGAVIDQAKTVNGQTEFGTDILTRITYTLEDPANMDAMQQAAVQTFESLLQQLTECALIHRLTPLLGSAVQIQQNLVKSRFYGLPQGVIGLGCGGELRVLELNAGCAVEYTDTEIPITQRHQRGFCHLYPGKGFAINRSSGWNAGGKTGVGRLVPGKQPHFFGLSADLLFGQTAQP